MIKGESTLLTHLLRRLAQEVKRVLSLDNFCFQRRKRICLTTQDCISHGLVQHGQFVFSKRNEVGYFHDYTNGMSS